MEYPQPPQMKPPPQPGQEYPVVVAPYQQTYMIPPPQPGQGYPGGGLVAPYPQQIQAWSTGLCDCCDDCENCCITCWCPCITFGQVAEIIDRGATSCGTAGALYILIMMLTGCHWIYSCMYRSRFRALNNLEEAPCCDCCVHFCCELCALCQLSRELKNRNWDLNLGYRMNLEKRRGAAAGVPPPTQGMIR